MVTKKCCKCNEEILIEEFTKQKTTKDGLYCVCKSCKKLYDTEYVEKNKVDIKEKRKKYYTKNKQKFDAANKTYVENNKEKIKQYQKQQREKNKLKQKEYQREYRLKNKLKRNEYEKERKNNDYLYRLTCKFRTMICDVFRRNGYTKKSRTHEILGCSYEEFKEYLESKFEPWMTWDNYGLYNGTPNYGWDMDHIIPSSSATTEEGLLKLNHFSNLQPLCSFFNRDIKKDRYN
jgi:hypothetical protein